MADNTALTKRVQGASKTASLSSLMQQGGGSAASNSGASLGDLLGQGGVKKGKATRSNSSLRGLMGQ